MNLEGILYRKKTFNSLFIIVIATIITVMASCKESQDDTWPEVIVGLPEVNRYYKVGDTIILHASYSDDNTLEYVKVALVDANNTPVLTPVSVMAPANPYELNAEMVIDDASLKGGVYYLQFQASDGVNTTKKYVKVNIDELEREFLYPVVFTSVGSNQVRILRTDTTDVFRSLYLYQGDYLGSDVSPAFGQLYFSGKVVSDLQAFSLSENKTLWSVPCQQSATGHWFETLQFSYPWLLVSQYDGFIRGYDRNGVQQFKSQMVANNFAKSVDLIRDYVIASMKEYSTSNRQLAVFHVSGGKLLDLQPVDFVPVGFQSLNSNQVIVFGNQQSDGVIAIYDLVAGTLSIINRIKDHMISDLDRMNNNVIYIAAGNEIYYYTYNNNSVIPFAQGYQNARLACETLGQRVYVASGSNLFVLIVPDGSVEKSYSFEGEVFDVHLVYNK